MKPTTKEIKQTITNLKKQMNDTVVIQTMEYEILYSENNLYSLKLYDDRIITETEIFLITNLGYNLNSVGISENKIRALFYIRIK